MPEQFLDAPAPGREVSWGFDDWILGANWEGSGGESSDLYRLVRIQEGQGSWAQCETTETTNHADNAFDVRGGNLGGSLSWRVRALVRVREADADVTFQIRAVGVGGTPFNETLSEISETKDFQEIVLEVPDGERDLLSPGGDLLLRCWPRSDSGALTRVEVAAMWIEAGPGIGWSQAVEPFSMSHVQVLRPGGPVALTLSPVPPDDLDRARVLRPGTLALDLTPVPPVVLSVPVDYTGWVDDLQVWAAAKGEEEESRVAMREIGDEDDLEGLVDVFRFSTGTGATAFGDNGGEGELTGGFRWASLLEGGAEVAGRRVPLTLGLRRQVEGVLVDRQRLIWQVHDGPSSAIVPTDGGLESLANDGDRDNIYDDPPEAGQYTTQLSESLVRLFEPPTSRLAFYVEGDAPTDLGEDGYSANPGVILRRLAQRHGGLTISDLLLAELDQLAVLCPGPIGISTGDSGVSLSDLMTRITDSVDAWWYLTSNGRLGAGVRAEAASRLGPSQTGGARIAYLTQVIPDVYLTDDDVEAGGPVRGKTWEVSSGWTVRHSPYDVTMQLQDVLGGVDDGWDFTQGWRSAWEPAPMGDSYEDEFPEAVDREGDSEISDHSVAVLEARRRVAVDRFPRDLWTFPLVNQMFRYRVNVGSILYYQGWAAPEGVWGVVADLSVDPGGRRVTIKAWAAAEGYRDEARLAAGLTTYIPFGTQIAGAAGRGDV